MNKGSKTGSLPGRGEVARRGMKRKALSSFRSGFVPLGYNRVTESEETKVVFDPKRAPLIKEAFCLLALESPSLCAVHALLLRRGLTTRDGHPISLGALYRIVTNPFYMGVIQDKGQIVPGRHQPLVSQSLFDQVQEKVRKRKHPKNKIPGRVERAGITGGQSPATGDGSVEVSLANVMKRVVLLRKANPDYEVAFAIKLKDASIRAPVYESEY